MGSTIDGRYALGRKLGAGGMATVLAAHDRRLDRPVAIKVLPAAGVDPVARRRFIAEARTAAGFRHPNAVAVYDAGEDDGLLYLVMELVEGPSLHAHLAAHGPLPVEECLRIADGVLAALADAHRAGIVHRDVKPGNVLLDGSTLTPKLADFGIAKRLDDLGGDPTSTGQILGTPNYIAPEQVAGEPATPQSDVYAAGIVLYEMLTGAAPFAAATPLATALAHRAAPAPDVRAARPDVPAAVAAVVDRALAKSPEDRFASADEMRAALDGRAAVSAPTSAGAATRVAAPPTVAMASPATQVMTTPPAGPRRRPWLVAAWLGVVALIAFLVAREASGGGAALSGTTSAPAASATSAVAAATTSPPATTAPPTTAPPSTAPRTTVPTTLDALVATVSADPGAWGRRGANLLDGLQKLAGAHGRKAADRATALLDDVHQWVADGELDPARAAIVEAVVGPLARPGGD